jgi:predicted  nucleic acid-binding Zn-ribbon protein
VVPLKIDQPFSCEEEISVLLSEDYFMMNKLLQQRKKEYDDYLERNIILEREVGYLKEKLKQKEAKMNMNNSNQGKMEKDFQATAKNYERKNSDLVKQLKKMHGELIEAKKEIKHHETTIKELKERSIMGKISGILPHKKTNSEKSGKK